jgi:predicted nucleic acid-binding protein
MIKIFVDTDICLDVLTGRKPYHAIAEKLFSLADLGKIKIYVSSLCFANIDYILINHYKRKDSRLAIAKFKTIVNVLSVDDKIIELAIASEFTDFEDAIQYNTAIENNLQLLITRNTKDFKRAKIKIMTPEIFMTRM